MNDLEKIIIELEDLIAEVERLVKLNKYSHARIFLILSYTRIMEPINQRSDRSTFGNLPREIRERILRINLQAQKINKVIMANNRLNNLSNEETVH